MEKKGINLPGLSFVKAKKESAMRPRNDQALSLRMRAGNAHVAISVDTRPQSIPNKKKCNTRKDTRRKLRKGSWD